MMPGSVSAPPPPAMDEEQQRPAQFARCTCSWDSSNISVMLLVDVKSMHGCIPKSQPRLHLATRAGRRPGTRAQQNHIFAQKAAGSSVASHVRHMFLLYTPVHAAARPDKKIKPGWFHPQRPCPLQPRGGGEILLNGMETCKGRSLQLPTCTKEQQDFTPTCKPGLGPGASGA